MKHAPTFDRCLIRRDKTPEKTREGMFIPPDCRTVSREAEVVAIGSKVTQVEVGDRVFTALRPGTAVEFDGETLYLVLENDIFSIIKE